jgi:putative peptidoglycan lipid II flippase
VFTSKVAMAVLVMAGTLWFSMGSAEWWFAAAWTLRLPALTGLVLLGMAVYVACLAAMGFRLRDFSRRGVE